MHLMIIDTKKDSKTRVYIPHKPVLSSNLTGVREIIIEIAAALGYDHNYVQMDYDEYIGDESEVTILPNAIARMKDLGLPCTPCTLHTTNNPRAMWPLHDYGIPIDHRINGYTCLMSQAALGHVKCVEVLLDLRSDVNAVDLYGWSVLQHAMNGGDEDTINILIRSGARLI